MYVIMCYKTCRNASVLYIHRYDWYDAVTNNFRWIYSTSLGDVAYNLHSNNSGINQIVNGCFRFYNKIWFVNRFLTFILIISWEITIVFYIIVTLDQISENHYENFFARAIDNESKMHNNTSLLSLFVNGS